MDVAGKVQDRTRNSVLRQMSMLQSMTLEELREKWLDLYRSSESGFLCRPPKNDEMQGKRKADEGAYFSYVTEIGFKA